jgi:L-amino acid N-acyltransferase YncA
LIGFEVRDARPSDASGLCAILNAIIRAGGTTALEQELSVAEFDDWFISGPYVRACQVAVAGEQRLGFQQLSNFYPLPNGWVDIGTFTKREHPVPGVGTALFAKTRQRAIALGYDVINATIRADNVPGLAYYAKMGFRDHRVDAAVPLADGRAVDRINRRFDLT